MICCICEHRISGDYFSDFWGNKSHPIHNGKEPDMCNSCGRIIGKISSLGNKKQPGFKMFDGRIICGICEQSSIRTQEQVKKSMQFIASLLRKIHVSIDITNITIHIQNKIKLQNKSKNPYVCGLCSSTISQQPGQNNVVSNIHILYGLPRIEFESILAHEVLHHWLHVNGITKSKFDEGFCNIGSALVLNYYIQENNDKLALFLRDKMNNSTNYDYGVQYQRLKDKLVQKGWKPFISEIINNKKIKL
jgi:hypothetical protein